MSELLSTLMSYIRQEGHEPVVSQGGHNLEFAQLLENAPPAVVSLLLESVGIPASIARTVRGLIKNNPVPGIARPPRQSTFSASMPRKTYRYGATSRSRFGRRSRSYKSKNYRRVRGRYSRYSKSKSRTVSAIARALSRH